MSWIVPRAVLSVVVGAVALVCLPRAAEAAEPFSIVGGEGEHDRGFFLAGTDGARLELPDGIRLDVEPGTELRVVRDTSRVWLGADGIHRVHIVLVRRGAVRARVEATADRRALALWSTERRLAVVTEGRAELVVDGDAEVVANTGGKVLVASGASWEALAAGFKERRVHGVAAPPESLPARPAVRWTRRVASAIGKAAIIPVRWPAVPGAGGYEVVVRRNGSSEVVRELSVGADRRSADVTLAEPGRYIVEAFAVDGDGIPGATGVSAPLHVLGVELPPGAHVARDGTLRLAADQVVRVAPVDGLEMAYGKSERWIVATEEARLYREKPTRVRYRVPGTAEAVSLHLVPQALQADILLGPKNPEFPRDDVHIAVRVVDEYGGRRPDVEPKIVVTAGVEPLELEWQQRGEFRYAKVPTIRGVGPWVIRVDVFDPSGRSLGHDFIEVAAGSEPSRVRVIPVAGSKGTGDDETSVAAATNRRRSAN